MAIYVGNLFYEVTQDDLRDVFTEYGNVKRVSLPTDRETGRIRGFGFVEMASDEEENVAIETLDGRNGWAAVCVLIKPNPAPKPLALAIAKFLGAGPAGLMRYPSRTQCVR